MSSTDVVFRVDASTEMGTGHVMRCLTLAEALRAKDARCMFVGRRHPGNLQSHIEERGFPCVTLDAAPDVGGHKGDHAPALAHTAWLGTSWQVDAAQTLAALGDRHPDWLVVDHYALDTRWERDIRANCGRVLAIDDLADRQHDCDLLLDQNLGRTAADYAGLLPQSARVLAGPTFALLRPEFARWRATGASRRREAPWRRILVTMGGVDQHNMTGRMLSALERYPLPCGCEVTVVMGAAAPWLAQVRAQARQLSYAAEVLVNVRDMERHISGADIAIGAAGTSAWERCCLGLPTITAVLADNQRAGAAALAAAGAVVPLPAGVDLEAALARALALLADGDRIRRMQDACLAVTDGLGTSRLVQEMLDA